MKKAISLMALCAASAQAAVVVPVNVSQDQWVGSQDDGSGGYGSNATVAEGGTGSRLSIWQPNPPGAWRYNRRAYFGFDVSGIRLSDVQSATFSVTTAANMSAGETGKTMYYWIHADNSGGDMFDETTLSKNSANGLGLNANGPQLSGSSPFSPNTLGAGTLLQAAGVGISAPGGTNTITFSAAALAELMGDTNDFVTISVYAGSPSGGSYGGGPNATAPITTTGPGFVSKEGGSPAQLIIVVPEPSSAVLFVVGALGLIARRKR